ncbi:MAG: hypothetical protein JRH11_00780 [Deltaproteobacteria bacterium]|nr:hypothetical protein [Deltaproteobacteria bacterium]
MVVFAVWLAPGLGVWVAPGLGAGALSAQVLNETMVPRGRIRVQAHAVFDAWDSRFGRSADGSESIEALGDDLTDPTSLSLFPGMPTLQNIVRDVTGDGGFSPVVGSTDGRITQDITRANWGIDVGVFDWLTVGAMLPWIRPRTALDVFFVPDSLNGNLGLNPTITAPASVTTFLGSTLAADAAAQANATTICAGGLTPACATAQALSQRAREFNASVQGAYGATPFFPLSSSTAGMALDQAAATLSADLVAAGLSGLSAMALATDLLSTEGFPLLPAVAGSGIQAAALESRPGIWAAGDIEVSARVRLLDNITPRWTATRTGETGLSGVGSGAARSGAESGTVGDVGTGSGNPGTPDGERSASTEEFIEPRAGAVLPSGGGIGYRVTASFKARLPTGTAEHPDILLDIGTGQGQTDFEGGMIATLLFGRRFGLTAGGRYGIQTSTSLIKRVAPLDLAMPPVSTRTDVIWTPGFYVTLEVAPTFHLSDALVLAGEYRFFHKGRDEFELVSPNPALDPTVLSIESGMKMHQIGGGLRYDTVTPWMLGEAPHPLELHLRLLTTIAGSGGHTPQSTRIEAGLRVFQRIWGPRR